MRSTAQELIAAVRRLDGPLVVVTGAGISLASGIPTFRGTDPGAVWKHDVLEMATLSFFERDPVESWRWYLSRFDRVLGAQPNAAHRALVELERWQTGRGGSFVLITQNIDALHARAGAERLIEVHGSVERVRCSAWGCRLAAPRGTLPRPLEGLDAFRAAPALDTIPRCPECEGLLRPHVLWFDEVYGEHDDYQWPRVIDASERARLLLFVGTSFSVGVTELLIQNAGWRGVPTFSIDPGSSAPPYREIRSVRQPAEVLLPEMVDALTDG